MQVKELAKRNSMEVVRSRFLTLWRPYGIAELQRFKGDDMLHFKDGPEQLRCYAGYVAGVFTMLFAFLARSLVVGSLIGFAGAMLVVMIARVGID